MKRTHALASAGLAAVLVGCGAGDRPVATDGPLNIVATTTIVADLAREVGGDAVTVTSLMGAGVDPHLYKASAGDVRRMAAADVIVYNGLHLEGKMTEILEQMQGRGVATVAVAECVPEENMVDSGSYAGLHDPHVWFDVSLWAQAADCLAGALAESDPAHAAEYRARAATYAGELDTLDAWVRERVAGIPEEQRVLVTAHDAFAYFGRAYGIDVRGLLGVSTASEAGTGDVQELAAFITERGIPALFVETSVPRRYVEALQEAVRARGHDVVIGGSLYSDALGGPDTDAATYEGTVRSNVSTIVEALGGGDAA